MLSHGDAASDPTVIPTESSKTKFLTGLPKHYLTCIFQGTVRVGLVCLDKVSRTTYREEKGLIFAILFFTIPFESSVDVSPFPRGGGGRDLTKGRLEVRGRQFLPGEASAMLQAPALSPQLLPSLYYSLKATSQIPLDAAGTSYGIFKHPLPPTLAFPCHTKALASWWWSYLHSWLEGNSGRG